MGLAPTWKDENVTDKHLGRAAEGMLDAISRRRALRRLAAGGVAAGAAAALDRTPAAAQNTLVSAATEAAARRAVNAINQALDSGDMSLLDLSFAPEYVNHTPRRSLASGQEFTPDLAGLQASLTELRGAIPDAVLIVDDVIASGTTAAVRATFRGTIDPAIISVADGSSPTVRIGGVAFGEIVGGLVVESWDYDEADEILGALAVTAPEEPVTEPEGGESRDVSDFQAVSLQGVGTLVLTQGETESLTIEAEPKVLRRIETVVDGGTLIIRPERSFNTDEPITYRLTFRQLNAIELAGAGQVEAQQLDADQLRLLVSGSGAISIADLTANTLDVQGSGNMRAELAGTVDTQTVVIGGASQYNAGDLASRVATVSAEAAARATVRVSEQLDAQASGTARIEYIGDPDVSESVSGVGQVTNVG